MIINYHYFQDLISHLKLKIKYKYSDYKSEFLSWTNYSDL
jgi:hypothetical protein